MSAPDMPNMGDQAVVNSVFPAPSDVPADLSARTAPDMSNQAMDPQGSDPTTVPAPAPSGKSGLWRNILAGALQGLAAGASVNTKGMSGGSALAAGAGAGVNQVLNVQPAQQQQLDIGKAQVAMHYANLAHIQREINLMPDDKREQYLNEAADQGSAMIKAGAVTPLSQPSDLITAQKQLQSLHAQNAWAVYSIIPSRNEDGEMSYMVGQFAKAPLQKDLPLKGAGDNGEDVVIPAGTPADQVGKFYTNFLSKKIENESKMARQDSAAADRSALADKNNAAKGQRAATAAAGQNVVAFDPEYQNADGSKGANVVLDKATAQQRGLFSYKADPSTINSLAGGMNDVQNKLNSLADVVNDTKRMSQVDPKLAAAMLNPTTGVNLSFSGHGGGASGGIGLATDRINAWLNNANVKDANQATKDYVAAFLGAHEAITQLPRLQTFGKSSRMTETQLHAALNLLPQPGDTASFAQQKIENLQTMIDPLRKQIPHMPGAELIPSWLEQKQKPPAATHVFDPMNGVLNLINNGGGQ